MRGTDATRSAAPIAAPIGRASLRIAISGAASCAIVAIANAARMYPARSAIWFGSIIITPMQSPPAKPHAVDERSIARACIQSTRGNSA